MQTGHFIYTSGLIRAGSIIESFKIDLFRYVIGLFGSIAAIGISLVLFIKDSTWRGTFGDQFGAVNALFSGLAFTGLIYTIILQRRDLELQRNDLKLQREELILTRQEMEEQTAEFEKQNETLRI